MLRRGETVRPRTSRAALPCLLVTCLAAANAFGQEVIRRTEHLDSDRTEAWAMYYMTSVTLLSGLSPPRSREAGSIEAGIEAGHIPDLSTRQRTVGLNGIKEEDLNKADVFARPRVTIGLPWRTALTLSYVPPVRVSGLKPHLFAFALERPLFESEQWTFGVRAFGQVGKTEGAITCPGSVARFAPGSPENRFGCVGKSADVATMRYGGVEFSGAYEIERLGGLTPYLTVAANYLDTRVQVKANTFGVKDRNRLLADTWTFSAGAGVVYPISTRLRLGLGVFYTPLDVVRPPETTTETDGLLNARLLLSYQLN